MTDKKLDVDDNWKAQAEQEKDRLAQHDAASAPASAAAASSAPEAAPASAARPPLPPASFEMMIEQYVTQILLALGAIEHPATGQRQRDLELAKHYIDLLAILETKTKGNLSKEEEELLSTALYQMRMNYVTIARNR